jgi:hypothetical protein
MITIYDDIKPLIILMGSFEYVILNFHYMLVQQLKQLHDKLKKLKSKKNISKEEAKEIKRIEKWFEAYKKAE